MTHPEPLSEYRGFHMDPKLSQSPTERYPRPEVEVSEPPLDEPRRPGWHDEDDEPVIAQAPKPHPF